MLQEWRSFWKYNWSQNIKNESVFVVVLILLRWRNDKVIWGFVTAVRHSIYGSIQNHITHFFYFSSCFSLRVSPQWLMLCIFRCSSDDLDMYRTLVIINYHVLSLNYERKTEHPEELWTESIWTAPNPGHLVMRWQRYPLCHPQITLHTTKQEIK